MSVQRTSYTLNERTKPNYEMIYMKYVDFKKEEPNYINIDIYSVFILNRNSNAINVLTILLRKPMTNCDHFNTPIHNWWNIES